LNTINKELIKTLMNVIHPNFRYDWDLVKWHFDNYFKVTITKQDWEDWKKNDYTTTI